MSKDIPSKANVTEAFWSLYKTISKLRDPQDGCPWDLEQTHRSLSRYMLEEAYEAVTEMLEGDDQALSEELGDVLLQVVLNAQVAQDRKAFSIVDVIQTLNEKMIRRHPHVFDPKHKTMAMAKDQKSQWEAIKAKEKAAGPSHGQAYFKANGVDKVYPATRKASAIGRLAAKIDFDWSNLTDVWQQFTSEVSELDHELSLLDADSSQCKQRIKDELGDLYFSLAQVCRHLGLDSELVAHHGNNKFLSRFEKVEQIASKDSTCVTTATKDQLEKYWQQAKQQP